MTYAFYYDAPGTAEVYAAVSQRVGEPPTGLLAAVVTRTGGGLRHLNVWTSREEWEGFRGTRLLPAVGAVLKELGIPAPSEAPVEHELDVIDVLTPTPVG